MSGWLDLVDASVVNDDIEIVCTAGRGSKIDYVVVSNSLAWAVSAKQDVKAPWATHVGLVITVGVEACQSKCRVIRRATAIAIPEIVSLVVRNRRAKVSNEEWARACFLQTLLQFWGSTCLCFWSHMPLLMLMHRT